MLRFRYLVFLAVCALIGVNVADADLRVKSFSELTDLDARVIEPKKDTKTGKNCPIVKVVTTYDGFHFDIGAMGAPEAVVYKKELGEIWLYLPVKTAKLKITHPKYGQFIDDSNTQDGYFWFPNARLQSSTSYRLVLEVNRGTIEVDDEDQVKTGYVIINSEPEGADVYIGVDDNSLECVGQTPFQKKYQYGRYSFSLRKNMYHSMQSFFDLN
ncbi:MAG: PEGA domain-containing protein, partial [Muribaculaceae bacterium]